MRADSAGGGPITEVVVKIHERCNIACDHCYMYESADQGWRTRPVRMSEETVRMTASRLGRHARDHDLPAVRVVLHGGEPLMAGPATIERAITLFRAAAPAGTTVSFAVQTNGVLLNDRFLELFRRHGVRVGVSLDGDRAANDRHRRTAAGRSSYEAAVAGIRLLREPANREIYAGLLCTVDLRNDPVGTYTALLEHEPPMIDLLLPHGNRAQPPPGLDPRDGTPYADWLIAVFDRWYGTPRRAGIRFFESVLAMLLGGHSTTEAIGPAPPAMIVVESDGTYEGSDALKTSEPGGATGLSVHGHSFDEAARHPAIAASRQGLAGLGEQCRACDVVDICGGGMYAHRYAPDDGFTGPSVYGPDLAALIRHVRRRVAADLYRLAGRSGA
jgi:uncharacterized protein